MKRILALLLALLMILSLTACKNANEAAEQNAENAQDAQNAQNTQEELATDDGQNDTPDDIAEEELSEFTFAVMEKGNDVIVSGKSETVVGEVACLTTFRYDDDVLSAMAVDYYLPDEATAEWLADELKKDPTVVADSVVIAGKCVSCTMQESEVEDLRELSREDLIAVMQYIIGLGEE